MNVDKLSKEFSQMHIDKARLLTQMANALSISGEVGVLLWLSQRSEDTFAVDIIDHFDLTPGRVANIVKKLEQKGYIERLQSSDDQRKARIFLTAKGISRANELFSEMNAGHARLIDALGEEDALQTMRILRRIISFIDEGIELHTFDL